MREIKNNIWLGAWLLIIPFLGVTTLWKERLIILTALVILIRAAARFRRFAAAEQHEREEGGAEEIHSGAAATGTEGGDKRAV